MRVPINVRSIEVRTWKPKSGGEAAAVEGLALEVGDNFTLASTIPFQVRSKDVTDAQRIASTFAGKNATMIVRGIRVNIQGDPVLEVELEAAEKPKA